MVAKKIHATNRRECCTILLTLKKQHIHLTRSCVLGDQEPSIGDEASTVTSSPVQNSFITVAPSSSTKIYSHEMKANVHSQLFQNSTMSHFSPHEMIHRRDLHLQSQNLFT